MICLLHLYLAWIMQNFVGGAYCNLVVMAELDSFHPKQQRAIFVRRRRLRGLHRPGQSGAASRDRCLESCRSLPALLFPLSSVLELCVNSRVSRVPWARASLAGPAPPLPRRVS